MEHAERNAKLAIDVIIGLSMFMLFLLLHRNTPSTQMSGNASRSNSVKNIGWRVLGECKVKKRFFKSFTGGMFMKLANMVLRKVTKLTKLASCLVLLECSPIEDVKISISKIGRN